MNCASSGVYVPFSTTRMSAEIGRSYNASTISRLANAITREHV